MKRTVIFWSLILLMTVCLVGSFSATRAATSESSFGFNSATGTITSYSGTDTDVVIPNTIRGVTVTAIGDYAFYQCSSITSVNIPSGVTSIGQLAFMSCSSLNSINIPSGVTSIGFGAFDQCSSLTSINIPSSVTSIHDWAFESCTSLTNLTIQSGVTSIGYGAFYYCTSLKSINIPSSVTSIGNWAFNFCSALTTINIPLGVTSIGEGTFYCCSSLTNISLPSSVTSIGDSAFLECTSLKTINLPSGLTSLGNYAFFSCTSLTGINLPSGVTSIGNSTFDCCTALQSIIIPPSVTSIGNWAFSTCTSLTSMTIPSSVTSIGDNAFFNCYSLTAMYFKGNAPGLGGSNVFNYCPVGFTIFYKASNSNSFSGWSYPKVPIDDIAPQVSNITPTTLKPGTALSATSSRTGTLYLVPKGTYANKAALDGATPQKTAAVSVANTAVSIDTTGLADGVYQIYAVDSVDSSYDPARLALGLGPAPNLSAASADIAIGDVVLTSTSIDENLAVGNTVGSFLVVDPATGTTYSYSLVTGTGSGDNGSFQINGAALLTKAVFDYETKKSYSIRVRVMANGYLYTEKEFTITIKDINEAPTNIALSSTIIDENQFAGITVGSFTTTDPDISDTCSYTLVSGTGGDDNSSFQIINDSLQTKAIFDYEAKKSYSIRVRASDKGGLYTEKQFTITVKDINESPTDITLTSTSVYEKQPLGTKIGTFGAADPDTGNTFTYTLATGTGSDDNAYFQINGASLQTNVVFDYKTKTIYNIRVRATDNGGLSTEKQFNIVIKESTAPADLIIVTIKYGDNFAAKLDAAAGGNRNTIASLKIITNGYSLSSDDFGALKNMATSGIGQLTYLDLLDTTCVYDWIPERAFENIDNNIQLHKIILPSSITGIGSTAFYNCTGLSGSLCIPERVTGIGILAFYNCSGLTGSLVIPGSVKYINSMVFFGCSGFTSLTLTNGLVSIGSDAFRGCSGFTGKLTIPSSVTSIEYNAFRDCSGFSGNLIIPDGITNIYGGTFEGCSGFNGSLTIPNSVTSIDGWAFDGCSGFTGNLVIPSGVTSIGDWAFYGCSGFTGNFTIPKSVASIGYFAFSHCGGLTGDLTIPNGITVINSGAFEECNGFNGNLTIPNSVTSIGYEAFYNCSGLTGKLTIPSSVTSIGSEAFCGCSGFTGNLIIPNSVTSLGDCVFYNCSGFTGSPIIPGSVTTTGIGLFSRCSGFDGSLSIPNYWTSIPNFTYESCSGLTGTLTIPTNVTSIGHYAFYNCSSLTGNLVIPAGVTTIGAGAFCMCNFDGNLTIPYGVITIDDSAFNNCQRFTGDLYIPDSVTTIGAYTFRECNGLTGSLIISRNVTSIGPCAFFALPVSSLTYHGSGIAELDLSDLFETPCNPNYTLTTLDLSNTAITSINANAFYNLSNINFSGMSKLSSVTIGAGMIDFSGGTAGAWYNSFSGTKIICCQRPVVHVKKDYPSLSVGVNSSFNTPAPIWLTANNVDISTLSGSGWFAPEYAAEISGYAYSLSYKDPSGNSESSLNTAKTGTHTVSYSFADYPTENYSRQYTVVSGTYYTVNFNSNGGTVIDNQSVKASMTATEPAAPTKAGYSFAGWYSDSGLANAFSFSTAITGNITLYAKWKQPKLMITSDQVLSESRLNGRMLQVTLDGTTFNTTSPSRFILNSTEFNLNIANIIYNDSSHCTIELAYTGNTGIGYNTDLTITIPGSQLTAGTDLTSNALIISADLVPGKKTGTYRPASNSDWSTAYNKRNEYTTRWNDPTLNLGKETTGWNNDGWLYFPNVLSAVPSGYQVDQAELVLKLTGFTGAAYLPRKIKVYMVSDPDSLGTPYFGTTNGFRSGLNFSYRDCRVGLETPWKTGAANILESLGGGEPLDVYEFLPQDYSQGLIKLDVTTALRSWQNGSPNQGLYIVAESDLLSGDQIYMNWKDSTDVKPYLEMVYTQITPSRPAKVTNLLAQSTINSVSLQWNPAGNVRVLRKTGTAPCDPEDGMLVYEGVAASITDEGLEKDKTYYYAIFAYDSNRTYSPRTWLKVLTGDWALVPTAPSGLTVTVLSATAMNLSWNDKSNNETGFVIERKTSATGWAQTASLPAGQTTYRDYGLLPNTNYYYQVKAINPTGSSAYATTSYKKTGSELVAPTKLAWRIVSANQVRLQWTDSPNESSYRIQVLDSGGTTVIRTINNIAVNTNNYLVTGLTANTGYIFKVIAVKSSATAELATTEVVTTLP